MDKRTPKKTTNPAHTHRKPASSPPASQHIATAYQNADLLPLMRSELRKDKTIPTLVLGEFLTPQAVHAATQYSRAGWEQQYIPDKYRFETRARKKQTSTTSATKSDPLSDIETALRVFVKRITGKEPVRESTRRISQSCYTLLHDADTQRPGVVAYLFLADTWDDAWGGDIVVVKNGETLLRFTPRANTLLIVERKKGVHSFIKYVNHRAGKKSYVMISS